MRTLGTGNAAQVERRVSSAWVRVQVEDHLGVMQTHPPYEVEREQPSVDTPIGQATVKFRRGEGASSFSPLMTVNPPLDLGRLFTVDIDAGSGAWTPVFSGRIDYVAWPERYGDVTIRGRDLLGMMADQQITTEREYGSEAGTALETVIQAVIDDNWDSSYGAAPTLYVPTPTGAVVLDDPPYIPSQVSIYEAASALAASIGAVIHQRWTGSAWAPSLVEPERDKTVPDHTFAPSGYYEVTQMEQDVEDVRNVVDVEYSDSGEARLEEQATDAASITRYGRRYMRIIEASDSPIRTSASALALAAAAVSDLAEPDATLEIACAYFWPGEVGIDLYRFTANDVHFSADQDLAPVAITHRLTLNQRPETMVRVRGKPSAGVLLWRRRARGPAVPVPADALTVSVERIGETNEFTVRFGAAVEEADIHWKIFDKPLPADYLTQVYAEENLHSVATADGDTFTVTSPNEDQIVWGVVIPRRTGASGSMEVSGEVREFYLDGGRAPVTITVEAPENTAGTQATLTVTIDEDPRSVVSSVRMWEQRKGVETGPFTLTEAAGVWTRTFDLLPKPHVVLVRGEVIRSDGQPAIPFGPLSADSDKEATVTDALPSYAEGTATVRVQFDSDTEVGVGTAGYRLDAGAETLVDVDADRRASVAVTQSTSAALLFEVRGYNEAGAAGPWFPVTIPVYVPMPPSFARITSISAESIQAGLCASSLYLTNRVDIQFSEAAVGDTWDLRRFIDGVEDVAVVVNEPVSTTQVDDEITGYQRTFTGSGELLVTYRADLSPAAGGFDSRDTPALLQELQACP